MTIKKYTIWTPMVVGISERLIPKLESEVRKRFGSADDTEIADEDIVIQAGIVGLIDLPDEWRID